VSSQMSRSSQGRHSVKKRSLVRSGKSDFKSVRSNKSRQRSHSGSTMARKPAVIIESRKNTKHLKVSVSEQNFNLDNTLRSEKWKKALY